MQFIAHRINTIAELARVPVHYGVEIDVRNNGKTLILQHDPFLKGEELERYLQHYRHGTLILNIKCERTEFRALELLKRSGISDYFFLDSSFPMIHMLSSSGERRIALRYSEFEGLDTLMAMKGRVDWIWIDCFSRFPIDSESYSLLKAAGYKLCLVSPELQNRVNDIVLYRDYLRINHIEVDAVCTKLHHIKTWET